MSSPSKWGELGESITGFFWKKNKNQGLIPPRLFASQHNQKQFGFQIDASKGAAYEIQTTSDLKTWIVVGSGASPGTPFEFVDVEATKHGFRFYRVVLDKTIVSNALVGFVSVAFPPGFSMISNPLSAADNRVAALFPLMPEGTTLNKFDTTLFRLTKNNYTQGRWANPGEILVPGEGAIISNPTNDFRHLTFVGEVMQGDLSLPIQPGFSIRSSQVPLAGALDSDLGFPLTEGDVIHLFDHDKQEYVVYTFSQNKWSPSPPTLAAGEAFWVGKTSASNWVQSRLVAKLTQLSEVKPE